MSRGCHVGKYVSPTDYATDDYLKSSKLYLAYRERIRELHVANKEIVLIPRVVLFA